MRNNKTGVAHAAAMIRCERKKRKLNQGVVARRLGVPQSWLSRVESGLRPIHIDEFAILAKAIGFNAIRAFRQLTMFVKLPRKKKQSGFAFSAK
jgi:transcriptional regulator with XRE-family HTH domain